MVFEAIITINLSRFFKRSINFYIQQLFCKLTINICVWKKSFTSLSVWKTFKFNLHVPDCRKNHIQYIEYSVYRTPYISEDTIVYWYKYVCFKFHKSWVYLYNTLSLLPLSQWQWCWSQEGTSLSAHVQSLLLWHSWARWQWHSPSWQYGVWSPGHMVEAHSLS